MGTPLPMISLILVPLMSVIAILTSQICYAQNSPEDYLNGHNRARSEVGVGRMTWDENVASFAQNYVNSLRGSCQLVHSSGPYGENLAWSSGDMTATSAIDMWVEEKKNYDFNSNSCFGGECLHYTQVVWRDSVRLGCAKVRCNNGRGTIISCNYDPPGNWIGQRPFDIITTTFQVPFSFNHDV